MNTFIEKLAEACREHRVPEKWLIAPSLRVGHQWLDQVTRTGGPVLNVHVMTVRSLAMKVLAPQLADGSVVVASPAVRRLVVAAAWQQVMKDDGYLGSARPTPGLLELAERSLLDLRMAGLGPGDLDGARFEQATKGKELRKLLAAYQAGLDDRNLIDHADAARRAVEALREGGPPDIVVICPDDLQLAVLDRSLLDALRAQAVINIPVDRPAHAATSASVESDLALLGWLERPADAPQPVGDGSVRIVHAVGEVNEVRGALRSCLADETSLDTVELLYTAADTYVPLIYDTAQRIFEHDPASDLGVPITFADGVPVRLTRPGRLLAAWHSWIHDNYSQSGLLRIMQSGLLALPEDDSVDPATTARLIHEFRNVGIGFGRDRYAQTLKSTGSLSKLVNALIAVSPVPQVDAAKAVLAARTLIADHARTSSKLDGLAHQRLLQELDGMIAALAVDAEPAGFDAWQWIEGLPDRVTAGGSGPRPGHLHVASVGSGGHSGRDRTIILGLDDGRFPSAGRQDPLLLDTEREGLCGEMPTSKTRLHEQVSEFGRLLCRLRGRLTLSFPSRSTDDDRETFAGKVVLEGFRLVSGQRDGDHASLLKWLDPAISFAPREIESCLDAGEWWLHQAAGDPPIDNLAELAGAAFEHLTRGRVAAAARESDEYTIFDGLVEAPGVELDLTRPGAGPVSVTGDLQRIGQCPLKYLYSQVLGIKPPRDVEVDQDVWLDSRDFGTLFHKVLSEFVAVMLAQDSWPPVPDRDLPRIAAIVEVEAAAARQQIPPPAEAAFRHQCQVLKAGAEIFVRHEARRPGPGRPVYLEAAIGLPPEDRATDLDAPEPVEISLPGGGTIRARGRIDRIDRIDDGRKPVFTLYDYKSGSYTKDYDTAHPFNQGRLVQHVLYMAVAEKALRAHVDPAAVIDEFRFVFPGIRTWGQEISYGRAIVEQGLEVIEKLCSLPASGVFPATNKLDDCRYCDYRAACRAVDRDLADLCAATDRKIDDPVLAPFAELRHGP